MSARSKATTPAKRKRAKPDPVKAWMRRLDRYRPDLMPDTLAALRTMYDRPTWQRVYDPTSELILTMLSANSADINAEKAFDALCRHWPAQEGALGTAAGSGFRAGWGGVGIEESIADWAAIADAPLDELIDVIRPGGLAPTKAPRIQAVLRQIFGERGDFSLEFLGEMEPHEALAWLTAVPGIGRKTASVVLLFAFGMPLMPVDRHVERVSKRIGLIPPKIDRGAGARLPPGAAQARRGARGARQPDHPRPPDVSRAAARMPALRDRAALSVHRRQSPLMEDNR